MIGIDVGIGARERTELSEKLGVLLADSYTLYLKTQGFHWNVTGSMFQTLHEMFEQQYIELAAAVDLLAERIRALGHQAPASFAEFTKLSTITGSDGVLSARDMVDQLLHDHETTIRTARHILPLAFEADDEVTADLITERLRAHEKTAWMLRSVLEE